MTYVFAHSCPHCCYLQDFVISIRHEGETEVRDTCRECGSTLLLSISVDVDVAVSLHQPGQPRPVIDPNQQALPL